MFRNFFFEKAALELNSNSLFGDHTEILRDFEIMDKYGSL